MAEQPDSLGRGRRASGTVCDAERRTIVGGSFRRLQRVNAFHDALRRKFCAAQVNSRRDAEASQAACQCRALA
ncbi:hypothetical protein CCL10_21695 [Pseudomonas syringae]|nr:hypothetical protein CCL10_21695 [Pseudomonas syringae]